MMCRNPQHRRLPCRNPLHRLLLRRSQHLRLQRNLQLSLNLALQPLLLDQRGWHVSVLGPLLFNVFVSDLPDALNKCTLVQYADDETIYKKISCQEDADEFQEELPCILSTPLVTRPSNTVKPVVTFGLPAWHLTTQENINKLSRVQIRAMHLAYGKILSEPRLQNVMPFNKHLRHTDLVFFQSSSREEEDVASNKAEIQNCVAIYKATIENPEQVKKSAIEKQKLYLESVPLTLDHLEDELASTSEQRALSSGSESDRPDSDNSGDGENDEPSNKRSIGLSVNWLHTRRELKTSQKKIYRLPLRRVRSMTREYDSDPTFPSTSATSKYYNKCLRPNNQANTVMKKRASVGENNTSNNRPLEKDATISAEQKKRIETESFEQQIEHVNVFSSILTAILKHGNLKQQSNSYEKLGTFVKNVTTLQKAEKTIVSKAISVVNPGPKRKSSKDAALRVTKDLHTNLMPAKKWSEVAGLLNSFSMNVAKLFKGVSSLYRVVQSALKAALEENIYKKFSDYCEVPSCKAKHGPLMEMDNFGPIFKNQN
ncbi:Hypothetical predicted protein [Cloeon dipterum]|uniref:Reverse transcriptase domain-containing protein n=1 Tax=Cloeon dipterum TaxID=197152 RepID=A0A8S1D5D1_9INSE|nr:Hypothetical predicted protein [Cloeon dipterum]